MASAKPSRDTYAEIADTILESLDKGVVPWRKPWTAAADGPRSVDGRPYRGINTFVLLLKGMSAGYTDPRWLTYKRATALGGQVRKGEKGTQVIFWKRLPIKTEDPATGLTKVKVVPMIRAFTVFNVDQCDGLTLKPLAGVVAGSAPDPIEAAEAIVAGFKNPPAITFNGGDRAFYTPAFDAIRVPARESYSSPEEVYSTLFHEIGHSTGHASRLNRKGITGIDHFGSDQYGREELVAEMTSAFLCGEAGIAPATIANSTSYIANWMKAIKEDKKAVVIAAAQAQKAADLVLNRYAAEEEAEQPAALAA